MMESQFGTPLSTAPFWTSHHLHLVSGCMTEGGGGWDQTEGEWSHH